MKTLKKSLSVIKETERSTWAYPVLDLESALIDAGVDVIGKPQSRVTRLGIKAAARLGLIRTLHNRSRVARLAILMGPAEYKLFPHSYFNEAILFCFDCWPNYFDRWEAIFRRNRTGLAFFTARQSAAYFTERMPEMRSVWVPEAVDPHKYVGSKLLSERSIDILELGRRSSRYHNLINEGLKHRSYRHLYEKRKGETIFPGRDDLVNGLAEARISICFPGSMTSPERCGNVETVTHRYFESMASNCIIVGKCPGELSDLFGFNPVIEVDFDDPVGQIEEILAQPGNYQELVSGNYRRMLEVGTWEKRAEFMLDTISKYLIDSDQIRDVGT